MTLLDSTERLTIVCGGCGCHIQNPESQSTEELVASVQACPPICVICSYRTVYSPRPESEVWESIIGLPVKGAQL